MIHRTDKVIVFDTETTGVDVENDRIVTAFVGLVSKDGELLTSKEFLINPGVPIPETATAVHGITNENAQEKGLEASFGVYKICQAVDIWLREGYPLVAYNAAFDLSLLKYEAIRHGLSPLNPKPVIDPFVLDKALDTYRKGKRTLSAVYEYWFGETFEGAHDAAADAIAAGRLAYLFLDALDSYSLDEIHEKQIAHAEKQAIGLQAHLRKKDPSAIVDTRWPTR